MAATAALRHKVRGVLRSRVPNCGGHTSEPEIIFVSYG
jgi:hypothetical protein